MKRIVVRCPICNTQKNEVVYDDLIVLRKSIDKGIVVIKISEGKVCEHAIYLEIDKNFSIRDTLTEEQIAKLKKEQIPHYLSLEAY